VLSQRRHLEIDVDVLERNIRELEKEYQEL
jgi:hypothetical protein